MSVMARNGGAVDIREDINGIPPARWFQRLAEPGVHGEVLCRCFNCGAIVAERDWLATHVCGPWDNTGNG